jgi:uncharacterized protein
VSPAPERTCVGCREKTEKTALVRIVRTPDGLVVDHGGGAPGRGAYMHRDRTCIEQAVRRGSLARAFRVTIQPEEVSNLVGAIVENGGTN